MGIESHLGEFEVVIDRKTDTGEIRYYSSKRGPYPNGTVIASRRVNNRVESVKLMKRAEKLAIVTQEGLDLLDVPTSKLTEFQAEVLKHIEETK